MSSTARLYAIPAREGAELAPIFKELADDSSGRVTVETIARDIRSGAWSVWAVDSDDDAALAWVLTSTYTAPSGLNVFRVEGIVGRERHKWVHLISELREAARRAGCALFECHARRGWRNEIPWLKHTNNFLEARV